MRVNERFLPGEELVMAGREEIDGRIRAVMKTYRVVKQYPHHVIVEDEKGSRRSITHAELMQNGLATQWIG